MFGIEDRLQGTGEARAYCLDGPACCESGDVECARGHDGRTGYQRVKTREFRTRLMGFGEFCRFKNRSQEPIASVSGGTRFHSGVFVGIDQRTGQYMIYSPTTRLSVARTVVRVPTLEK